MPEFVTADGVTIVRLTEPRLDAARTPAFKQALLQNIQGQPERILLDVALVDFIDSTGLGALVSLLKMMGSTGKVALSGVKPPVRRLFEITKLNTVFALFESRDDAEASLRR